MTIKRISPEAARSRGRPGGGDKAGGGNSKAGPSPTNGHAKPSFSLGAYYSQRWLGKEPPLMPMLVADIVPDHCTTLLAADGGVGKSILMQMLCTCVASHDKPFLGRETAHGGAVFLTAEDPENVLHHRQLRICEALGVPLEEIADQLIIRSMADEDMVLFREGLPTTLLLDLEAELANLEPRLIALDSATYVYDDNEIDRRSVRKFLSALNGMSRRHHCSTLLAAHTSRTSDDSAARLASGSTSWVFQARAAIRLSTTEGDTVKLSVRKANYSRAGLEVDLRWTDDGVLMPPQSDGVLGNIQQRKDDDLVLAEIAQRWDDPAVEPLSRSTNNQDRYLPAYMARLGRMTQRRAQAALTRLTDAKKITTDSKRRGLTGLRLVSHEKTLV
jgi:RecA-family ATPase